MNRKLNIVIIAISLTACASAPFILPKVENQKTIALSAVEIKYKLLKSIKIFCESTSSKDCKIGEQLAVDFSSGSKSEEVALKITNYKPKDSSFTECTIASNGGWANKWNGLDHGEIYIFLIPPGREQNYESAPTNVKIFSKFDERYYAQVPGDVVGYVGGYAVQGDAWVDKGSHCYSTGIIERSIFDLIQSNTNKH